MPRLIRNRESVPLRGGAMRGHPLRGHAALALQPVGELSLAQEDQWNGHRDSRGFDKEIDNTKISMLTSVRPS